MQVAAYGERTTERMSIAAWIVRGLVIVEYPTDTAAKFPFGKSLAYGISKVGK